MEENRPWTDLPDDVFLEIMKRLPLKDYLGSKGICRAWREKVSKVIANKHCCPLLELPLVFLQTKDLCFFYNLLKKNVQHKQTLVLDDTQVCHGSVEGWLIMSDYSEEDCAEVFFLNPVTDVRIVIPSKLYFPYVSFDIDSLDVDDGKLHVAKMVASSRPNSDGSDCYLIGLMTSFCHIAVYKLFDKSWTIIETEKDSGTCFEDVEIFGTKLYVTDTTSNSILVYDLKDSNRPLKAKVLVKLPQKRPSESRIIGVGDHHIDIDLSMCFLAKDEVLGELYFIYMYYNMEYTTRYEYDTVRLKTFSPFISPPQVTAVEVFKLDMNKDPIELVNVKLDDKVACVSSWKSLVMSRDAALNYNKELITGNKLYFVVNFQCPVKKSLPSLQMGMFCLTESSIKYFPHKTLKHCRVRYPFWFVPSIW